MASCGSAYSAPAGYSRPNDFFLFHFAILGVTQDKFRLKLLWLESVPNSSCYVVRLVCSFIQRYKINSLLFRTLQRKLIEFDAQYL